jgi:hypothetical protein
MAVLLLVYSREFQYCLALSFSIIKSLWTTYWSHLFVLSKILIVTFKINKAVKVFFIFIRLISLSESFELFFSLAFRSFIYMGSNLASLLLFLYTLFRFLLINLVHLIFFVMHILWFFRRLHVKIWRVDLFFAVVHSFLFDLFGLFGRLFAQINIFIAISYLFRCSFSFFFLR